MSHNYYTNTVKFTSDLENLVEPEEKCIWHRIGTHHSRVREQESNGVMRVLIGFKLTLTN